MWVAFAAGGVAVHENGAFRTYAEGDGIARGRIGVIQEDRRGGIWMSSATGLTRLRDGVSTTVTRENGLPDGIAPSIVEDHEGQIWLGVRSGAAVVRVNPAEIDRAAVEPGYQIDYLLYDETDGLEESIVAAPGTSDRCARQRWAAVVHVRGSGIAVIDPRRLPTRRTVARPHIDRIVANGQAAAPEQRVVLPGGTETLQVQFSALSLTSASKLRFRYRLDGLEQQWRYPGEEQHAIYAGLQPGDYRFRLEAAADGEWSEHEAVWAFSVPPPFYRTGAFYADRFLRGSPVGVGGLVAAAAVGEALLRAGVRRAGPREPRDSRHAAAESRGRGARTGGRGRRARGARHWRPRVRACAVSAGR